MMSNDQRRVKESVAIVLQDTQGRFLAVQRADDDSFGGMWGLPAASVRSGETLADTARRAARDKLGLDVEVGEVIGDRTEDKGEYDEHLTEFVVLAKEGQPAPLLAARDQSVSQYAQLQFSDDPELLVPAAQNGSICSRIYLEAQGLGWDNP